MFQIVNFTTECDPDYNVYICDAISAPMVIDLKKLFLSRAGIFTNRNATFLNMKPAF